MLKLRAELTDVNRASLCCYARISTFSVQEELFNLYRILLLYNLFNTETRRAHIRLIYIQGFALLSNFIFIHDHFL